VTDLLPPTNFGKNFESATTLALEGIMNHQTKPGSASSAGHNPARNFSRPLPAKPAAVFEKQKMFCSEKSM
jgi:hypothetical protein